MRPTETAHPHPQLSVGSYEPPRLVRLGAVHELTLSGGWQDICAFGKEFGGSDGWTFMGITVPVSNRSA